MGESVEKVDGREPGQLRLRAQQGERAERVGAAPGKARTPRSRQRFRQHQQPVERVGEAQRGRDPERQARIDIAGSPPSAGPSTKPAPKATPSIPKRAERSAGAVTSAT